MLPRLLFGEILYRRMRMVNEEKKFTVSLINKCPTYEVHGDKETSLDAVWNSQKCFFSQGTRVLISDGVNARVFEKGCDSR